MTTKTPQQTLREPEYKSMLDDECRGCGKSLRHLMTLAIMQDEGCELSPSATYCYGSESHNHFPKDDDLMEASV